MSEKPVEKPKEVVEPKHETIEGIGQKPSSLSPHSKPSVEVNRDAPKTKRVYHKRKPKPRTDRPAYHDFLGIED
jgi:hypothetical protein